MRGRRRLPLRRGQPVGEPRPLSERARPPLSASLGGRSLKPPTSERGPLLSSLGVSSLACRECACSALFFRRRAAMDRGGKHPRGNDDTLKLTRYVRPASRQYKDDAFFTAAPDMTGEGTNEAEGRVVLSVALSVQHLFGHGRTEISDLRTPLPWQQVECSVHVAKLLRAFHPASCAPTLCLKLTRTAPAEFHNHCCCYCEAIVSSVEVWGRVLQASVGRWRRLRLRRLPPRRRRRCPSPPTPPGKRASFYRIFCAAFASMS